MQLKSGYFFLSTALENPRFGAWHTIFQFVDVSAKKCHIYWFYSSFPEPTPGSWKATGQIILCSLQVLTSCLMGSSYRAVQVYWIWLPANLWREVIYVLDVQLPKNDHDDDYNDYL